MKNHNMINCLRALTITSSLFMCLTACNQPASPAAKPLPAETEGGGGYTPTADDKNLATNPSSESPLIGSQWNYSQNDDDMGKGTSYFAQLTSSNTVDFDFPYSGEQHASLMLRSHPRYGKNVIFRIEKGQVLCHSYDSCTVLVRFDDDEAIKFSASSAADNSSETIFLNNYSKFVEKVKKAKLVRISVNIYQQGAPVFDFDVSGFDSELYKPKN